MALEDQISRVLYVASRAERMIHDEGPWTIEWGPHVVPATKTLSQREVSFEAQIPEVCWLERPEQGTAILRCRGEVVAMQHVGDPGDGPFVMRISATVSTRHLTTVR